MDLGYPKECKNAIHRLTSETGMNAGDAYAMLLLTAALWDLHPEDDKTVDLVLEDCGIFPQQIA